MRVLMLSKACIVGIYQPKLEAIARRGVDLTVLVPPEWRDERGVQRLERSYTAGYRLRPIPIRFNGNFHLHHYPTLAREIADFQPQIVHIDEEAYNLATWQALRLARRAGARSLFFTWQNIVRRYPPPFSWGERWVLRRADYAIAGAAGAADVLRAKGYRGRLAVIPQFGTSETLFTPRDSKPQRQFTIGYIGRVVPEKGIDVLLRAAARMDGDWRMRVVGGGSARVETRALAQALIVDDRVDFVGQLPSAELPAEYHKIDVLVLPSLTRPNWKEQFGRVLVEAMASGVPVIGSDSGAIPGVIGAAGRLVPEGDVEAFARALAELRDRPRLRSELSEQGRARFLAHFTHEQVAESTVAVYREIMAIASDAAAGG
ncbi:MAG: glycosyltransferase family 4 protein [Chloroflexi bacterium]|nr:glycosyltransferase family 4 protein [Chloroflexota bacterium]